MTYLGHLVALDDAARIAERRGFKVRIAGPYFYVKGPQGTGRTMILDGTITRHGLDLITWAKG